MKILYPCKMELFLLRMYFLVHYFLIFLLCYSCFILVVFILKNKNIDSNLMFLKIGYNFMFLPQLKFKKLLTKYHLQHDTIFVEK